MQGPRIFCAAGEARTAVAKGPNVLRGVVRAQWVNIWLREWWKDSSRVVRRVVFHTGRPRNYARLPKRAFRRTLRVAKRLVRHLRRAPGVGPRCRDAAEMWFFDCRLRLIAGRGPYATIIRANSTWSRSYSCEGECHKHKGSAKCLRVELLK